MLKLRFTICCPQLVKRFWLEDADSIEAKLGIMAGNNLAGVAEWRLGFETADVWDKIAAYVGK